MAPFAVRTPPQLLLLNHLVHEEAVPPFVDNLLWNTPLYPLRPVGPWQKVLVFLLKLLTTWCLHLCSLIDQVERPVNLFGLAQTAVGLASLFNLQKLVLIGVGSGWRKIWCPDISVSAGCCVKCRSSFLVQLGKLQGFAQLFLLPKFDKVCLRGKGVFVNIRFVCHSVVS